MPSTSFHTDSRGVSEILGAVLLFGLLITFLVLLQLQWVPLENSKIEFEHSHRALQDIREYGIAVEHAAHLQAEDEVSVEAGVRYPPRPFLLNPPAPTGDIRTGTGTFAIRNAKALHPETDDYWTGDPSTEPAPFPTNTLVFEPNYNQYQTAPTTYFENGVIYQVFPDGTTPNFVVDSGDIISGRRITLVALDGELATSSTAPVTVDAIPVSAPAQAISVTNPAAGNPVTLTLPTSLTQDDWDALLEPETVAQGGHVDTVTVSGGFVTVELEEGQTYDIRLAKVGTGPGITEEPAHYITTIEGGAERIPPGSTEELVVEVRDRFNNPVSGVQVTFDDGDTVKTLQSNEDGRATASYQIYSDRNVKAFFPGYTGGPCDGDLRCALFEIQVDTGGTTGGGRFDINPNAPGSVVLDSTQLTGCTQQGVFRTCNAIELTFRNLAGGQAKDPVEARINFYNAEQLFQQGQQGPPSTPRDNPDVGILADESDSFTAGTSLAVSGPFTSASLKQIPDGGTRTYKVKFLEGGNDYDMADADFFVMSLIFDDASSHVYFVAGKEAGTGGPQNQPPTADAGGPYTVDEGATVGLTGAGSSDGDGTIQSYAWAITSGPGSLSNANSATPTYNAPADVGATTTVTVELTVTDVDGADAVDGAAITVQDLGGGGQSPVAEFTYDRRNAQKADFDASLSTDDGNIVSYEWDLDDDGTYDESGETINNAAVPEGATVTLRVTDDEGLIDTVTKTIP